MPVGDIVRRNAKRYPKKEAIVFHDIRLTWQELNNRVNKLSHALIEKGIKKGDRVGILSYNSHQYIELIFATAKIGVILVPINYRLTVRDHIHIIKDSGIKILFTSYDFVKRAGELKDQFEGMKFVGIGATPEYMDSFEEMIRPYPETELDVKVEDNDLLNLYYTSGTTGVPKGVLRDHRSLEVNTNHVMLIAGAVNQSHNHLVAFPLTSAGPYGLVIAYCYLGCTHTIIERMDIPLMLQTIEKERVNVTVLAPTMLAMLLDHPDFDKYDLSSMRLIYYGAAPMPLELLKAAMKKFPGCKFASLYGLTETYWGASLLPEDHTNVDENPKKEERLKSVGREVGTTEIFVVDSEEKEVPRGEEGEIMIKGRMVMREYLNLPELNQKRIKEGGILTGDIGKMDEDGYIYLLDRKEDMIISGGYNIYPYVVENVLYGHPAVLEATVIGVSDKKWGEAVKAIVFLKQGMACGEKELIDFCGQYLADFMKPKTVEFFKEPLPKNSAGKIVRKHLKERYQKN